MVAVVVEMSDVRLSLLAELASINTQDAILTQFSDKQKKSQTKYRHLH